MMKTVRLFFSTKSYSSKRGKFVKVKHIKNVSATNPGLQHRLKKMYKDDEFEAEMSENKEFEDLQDDVDYLESDFIEVGKSYDIYRRETVRKKEILKNQITFNKFMKEVEPSFLTFAEKEQIKYLHESDPQEWNVEKLSESFPGLPHTIKKVLHAKWTVKSKETVLRYDEKVFYNWEAFRAGELSVSPKMKEHLEKFIDRQIILANRDKLAEQFVQRKVELPKPKSQFFSRIARKFLLPDSKTESISEVKNTSITIDNSDDNKNTYQVKEKLENYENFKQTQNSTLPDRSEINKMVLSPQKEKKTLLSQNPYEDNNQHSGRLTFDQFLQSSVDRTENSAIPEDIVLKETYKEEMEKKILFQNKSAITDSSTESSDEVISKSQPFENSESLTLLQKEKTNIESDILIKVDNKSNLMLNMEISPSKVENCELSGLNTNSLDTYVKEWHKNNIDDVEVAPYIQIPKHRYKPGMTYRVKDCYYDDDGEFLFRVPGLLTELK